MDVFLQDVLVSGIALGAFLLLVQRVAGLVRPAAAKAACDRCSSCSPAGHEASVSVTARQAGIIRLVPVDGLRSAGPADARATRDAERLQS